MISGLAVSRDVHFRHADGRHLAAKVVKVGDREQGIVNLIVWEENGLSTPKLIVEHDPTAERPNTWHFPERVE